MDMSQFIVAKSDQLNADDLLGGPITVRITKVSGNSDKEQPISIHYDGDEGKPYKPGKSMRRVLVGLWGKESDNYIGRRMTLYRDPEVTFGKIKVGGIRISHMSDIEGARELALAVKKGAKAMFAVQPLPAERPRRSVAEMVDAYIDALNDLPDLDAFRAYQLDDRRANWIAGLKDREPAQHARIVEANSRRTQELQPVGDSDDDDDDGGDPGDDDDSFPGDPS